MATSIQLTDAEFEANEKNIATLQSTEIEQYRGEWVAVEDGVIIVHGSSAHVRARAQELAKKISHTLISYVWPKDGPIGL